MSTTESAAYTTNANTGAQGAKVAPEITPGAKAATTKKRAPKATKPVPKRGFVSGTVAKRMKLAVASFKTESGERA